MIVRSDIETKGDGKKIAIQHYDELGRVRLTRTLENPLTEDATNEQDGIKVETRYLTTNPNSYTLTSNPFRAATATAATSEPSMGWTRSKSINTGKHSETETFSGASCPRRGERMPIRREKCKPILIPIERWSQTKQLTKTFDHEWFGTDYYQG